MNTKNACHKQTDVENDMVIIIPFQQRTAHEQHDGLTQYYPSL